jgi:hypothetical protein
MVFNIHSRLMLHEFRSSDVHLLIRYPKVFFDGVPPDLSHSSARIHPHSSSIPQGSTLLSYLFHRNCNSSSAHDASPSSPLDWVRNLLKWHRRGDEDIELYRHSPAVVEVPCAPGQRRNYCAKERRKKKSHPSSQPRVAVSSPSTTPDIDIATAATSVPSRPHAMIRHPGLWTRFWLFIGCISYEYTDDRH